jgi:hypothetical protein
MQIFKRLPSGDYLIADGELAIVCTPTTSYGGTQVIGIAFYTRDGTWRCLRRACIDIGLKLTAAEAVDLILADDARLGSRRAEQA